MKEGKQAAREDFAVRPGDSFAFSRGDRSSRCPRVVGAKAVTAILSMTILFFT